MFLRCLAVVAALALFDCEPTRYAYAPVGTTSADLEGARAIITMLPPDAPRGDVRLSMVGVTDLEPLRLSDSTLRAVHVALEVSNRSDQVWTIDPSEARISLAANHERSDIYATTLEITRATMIDVAPGSKRLLDLYFPLPIQLGKEGAVPPFELFWTVHLGSRVITQRTPFHRLVTGPAPLGEQERNPAILFDSDTALPGSEPPDRRHAIPEKQ